MATNEGDRRYGLPVDIWNNLPPEKQRALALFISKINPSEALTSGVSEIIEGKTPTLVEAVEEKKTKSE